jgi:hypothetical protein
MIAEPGIIVQIYHVYVQVVLDGEFCRDGQAQGKRGEVWEFEFLKVLSLRI